MLSLLSLSVHKFHFRSFYDFFAVNVYLSMSFTLGLLIYNDLFVVRTIFVHGVCS